MIGSVMYDEPTDIARQRGRWFVLLGGLLGGIVAIATSLAFYLENWGRHIGGGPGERAHDIGIGMGVALTVIAIVVVLMVWRARLLLLRANVLEASTTAAMSSSSPVSQAVAAWTSSVLSPTRAAADHLTRPEGDRLRSSDRE